MCADDDEIDIVFLCVGENIVAGISSPNGSLRFDTSILGLLRDCDGYFASLLFEFVEKTIEIRNPFARSRDCPGLIDNMEHVEHCIVRFSKIDRCLHRRSDRIAPVCWNEYPGEHSYVFYVN